MQDNERNGVLMAGIIGLIAGEGSLGRRNRIVAPGPPHRQWTPPQKPRWYQRMTPAKQWNREQEASRRRRQIAAGTLTSSNGLIKA